MHIFTQEKYLFQVNWPISNVLNRDIFYVKVRFRFKV